MIHLRATRTIPGPLILLMTLSSQAGQPGEADQLVGRWMCISAVRDGKPLPEEVVRELQLTLTADKYATQRGQQVLFESTYRIDSAKKPKHIDVIGTEGESAGKPAQGIYSLEGEKLTLCYTMPGRGRPAEFDSKPGSEATLTVWKRSQP